MKRFLSTIFCVGLIHCGSSEVGNPIAWMDIQDATTLFISSQTAVQNKIATRGLSSQDSTLEDNQASKLLYKTTSEGSVLPVDFYDSANKKLAVEDSVYQLIDVNDSYLVVVFNYMGGETHLVRKSDGATFLMSGEKTGWYPIESFDSDPIAPHSLVLSDKSGNLYYRVSTIHNNRSLRRILKINVQDPNKITRTFITPETDDVFGFTVDLDGNLIYSGDLAESSGVQIRRIVKTDSSLANVDAKYSDFWRGLDEKISLLNNAVYPDFDIAKLSINESKEVVYSGYDSGVTNTILTTSGSAFRNILMVKNRLYLTTENNVVEAENPSKTSRLANGSAQISKIISSCVSSSYYYLSGLNSTGQPVLIRVNPETDAMSALITPGEYEISAMSAKGETVSFSALRFTDGARVIGEIDADGKLTILKADLSNEVTELIRIK